MGKGFVVPRYRIQTQEDVDNALTDLKEQNPAFDTQEMMDRTRHTLEAVLAENRVLPYVLGGAFYYLSNEANQNSEHLQQVVRRLWPDIAINPEEIVQAYERHLNSLQEQKRLDRAAALKALQRAAKVLEDARIGKSKGRRKIEWWKQTNFPVRPPLEGKREIQEIQEIEALSTFEKNSNELKAPKMVKKRKTKSTTTTPFSSSSSSLFSRPLGSSSKKPRIEETCSNVILSELKRVASELQLDIANSDIGLKKLCQQKGGSLDAAVEFMRRWKMAVDAVRAILLEKYPHIHIDDRTLQQQVIVQSQSVGRFDVDHIVNLLTNLYK